MWKWSWVVVAALALTSAAPLKESEPNGPVTLRDAEFDSTVANGTWWVKFFSPYCPHCMEFAPIWNELYQKVGKEAAEKHNFYFANVNCVEDGDLCDRKEIMAFPVLQIFEKGELKHIYGSENPGKPADKSLPVIEEYYRNWTSGIRPPPPPQASSTSSAVAFPSFPEATKAISSKFPSSSSSSFGNDVQSHGESVALNKDKFESTVQKGDSTWLVKFHSPRCPHCVEMKPAWDQMAKEMEGRDINIGEVNCDIERRLCKDVDIDRIPSIRYFDGNAETEYKGLRGYSDLLAYAKSAEEAKDIKEIDDIELDEIVRKSDQGGQRTGRVTTNFIYFYDDATVHEDFQALRQMAVSVIGNAKVYKTRSKKLADRMKVKQYPSLYAVLDHDRWLQFPAKTPRDIRDSDTMVSWAKATWLSLVPQLTPANAREILDHAKYVVLAVIDPREVEEHERAIKEMKATAFTYIDNTQKQDLEDIDAQRAKKQVKIDEAKDKGDEKLEEKAKKIRVEVKKKPAVGFAWIDQVFWERWIKGRYGHDNTRTKPRAIISDENGSQYWDVNSRGKYIDVSRSQLLDAMEAIMDPHDSTMTPKALHNSVTGYLVHIKVLLIMYWHWFVIIGLLAVLLRISRSARRRRHGGNNGQYQPAPVQAGKLD